MGTSNYVYLDYNATTPMTHSPFRIIGSAVSSSNIPSTFISPEPIIKSIWIRLLLPLYNILFYKFIKIIINIKVERFLFIFNFNNTNY